MSGGRQPLSTVERAYQLARSGTCRGLEDIRRKLTSEGHESVQAHLSGRSIKRDLMALCKTARAPAAAGVEAEAAPAPPIDTSA